MKICIVTGSNGLVGSSAVDFFLKKKFKVIGIDNNLREYFFGKDGSTSWVKKINLKKNNFEHKNIDIRNYKKIENIKTEKLDFFTKKRKLNKIDLLKVDTEGHELNVVKSGLKTLKKTRYLLIEFRQNDLYLNYSSQALHKIVLKNNFKLIKKFKFPLFSMEDRLYKNSSIS